jgi:predicted metalloprotease with PDZ domain
MITTVKRLKFGPYRFRKVPTHIFVDEFNVTAYPVLGGLLGNDIFRRFNLVLNYPAKEIHFLPNGHYSESFDYSYTGMGIYFVNGEIIIEDVLEGSPAEMAGLKGGDRILSIEKNFSNNIQTYKNMLQVPGAKLKMIVIRDGQPINVTLKVKSIL